MVSWENFLLHDNTELLMLKMLFDKEKVNEEHGVLLRRTQGAWALSLGALLTRGTDFGSREAGELDWQLSKAPSIQEPSSREGHLVSLSRTFCILKMGTRRSLQVTSSPSLQTEEWSAVEQGPHSSYSSEPKLRFIFRKGAGRTEALGL